jgi:hypothetical protein
MMSKLSASSVALIVIVAGFVLAQSPDQQRKTREITSEDFVEKRPTAKPSVSTTSTPKKHVYHLAKRLPAPRKNQSPALSSRTNESTGSVKPETVSSILVEEQIGITLWRLRPSAPDDDGPLISVIGDSGKPAMWTPVRAKADHMFTLGELVRITVESPRDGVLYVVDREQYRDGTLGDAMLIFPTEKTRSGDNRVSAGYLVDIPSWTDRTPYFMLSSTRKSDYAGELLTFMITSRPIPGLTIGPKPFPVSREQIEKWEELWGTEVELFEMDGGVGEAKTKVEQEATRPHTRQLTQQEPVPQTIYRIKVPRVKPVLINVSVRAKA